MNRSRLSGPVTFCVTAVILLPAVCASADTLHVGPGQTYATIQSAIDASFFGDEILVHDGLYQENVVVDVQTIQPEIGDILLLCSDGLNGMLDDSEIEEIVHMHKDDLANMAAALIQQANDAGGEDNCTVVLVEFAEE